jgi:hypothetical protein
VFNVEFHGKDRLLKKDVDYDAAIANTFEVSDQIKSSVLEMIPKDLLDIEVSIDTALPIYIPLKLSSFPSAIAFAQASNSRVVCPIHHLNTAGLAITSKSV